MRRMTGQLLLILYSFLFLLLSPADLNFVVGFLVSLICIGMQMFLKDDWERYVLLICILAGSWYCVGICEFLPVLFYGFWTKENRGIMILAVAGGIFTGASGIYCKCFTRIKDTAHCDFRLCRTHCKWNDKRGGHHSFCHGNP